MKINTYLLSFFILGLMSCQKESELIAEAALPKEEVLFTINLNPNSANHPDWTSKYLITDADGQILDIHEYKNGEEQIILSSSVNYGGGNLNFYEIIQSPEYLIVSASVDREKGTVMGEPNKFQTPAIIENTAFKIRNFPEFDRASYSTSRFSERFDSIDDTVRSSKNLSYQLNDRLYMHVVKGNKGFYNFFDIKPENGNFNVDASKCNIPSLRKEIKLAKNDYFRHGHIYGKQNSNKAFAQALDFFQSKANENAILFYPDGIYKSFVTSIGYIKENTTDNTVQGFGNNYIGDIPSNDAPLNTTANIIKPELTNFEVSFTGKFKYYYSAFSKTINLANTTSNQNKTISVSVTILAPPHIKTFKLPNLSSVIDNIKYLDNLKVTHISLTDYNCDDISYSDLISGKSLPEKYITKEMSNYYPNNGGFSNFYGSLPEQSRKLLNNQHMLNQPGRNMLMNGSFNQKLQLK